MKQLDEEQKKVFAKEDEIMKLQDKVQQEMDVNVELREQNKTHEERIKELEDELANRPEIKDATSSESEEKPDLSDEVEEWKRKYEKTASEFE